MRRPTKTVKTAKRVTKSVRLTELTSRDIDRQSYPHYFLKEIGEAPRSVEHTIQGCLAVVEQAGRLQPRIELDETVIPARLAQAFREQRIRPLFFMLVVDSFP